MKGKYTQLTCLLLNPNSCQLCLGETEEQHHQTETHVGRRKRKRKQNKAFSQLLSSSSTSSSPCKNSFLYIPLPPVTLFLPPNLTLSTYHPVSNYTLSLLLSALRPLPWQLRKTQGSADEALEQKGERLWSAHFKHLDIEVYLFISKIIQCIPLFWDSSSIPWNHHPEW